MHTWGCLTTGPSSFPYTCCLLIRTLFLQRGETTSPNSHSSSVDSSKGLTLQSQLSLSLAEVHSVAFTGAGVCSVCIHACVQLCARAHPGVRWAVMQFWGVHMCLTRILRACAHWSVSVPLRTAEHGV